MSATLESIEDIDAAIAQCLEFGRGAHFAAGDLCARRIGRMRRTERQRVLGQLAALCHCTADFIGQLAAVAEAFPPETRHPDIAWSLYRACIRAAKRNQVTPVAALDKALAENWHVRAVNAWGAPSRAAKIKTVVMCPSRDRTLVEALRAIDEIVAEHLGGDEEWLTDWERIAIIILHALQGVECDRP